MTSAPTAFSGPIALTPQIAWKNPVRKVIARPAERIPALDGLRGIAILMVLLRHSIAGTPTNSPVWTRVLEPLRLTWSGVDLFFVLSGFLIGGILLDARCSPRYFQTFYIRRAFRILPVYFVFMAVYLGRHLPTSSLKGAFGETSHLQLPWLSFFTFTQNFWMVTLGWFGPMTTAPTWSLAVEEQFYLTVPIIIRRLRTSTLYAVIVGVIVFTPILRAVFPRLIAHGEFACYVLMPCRADALSLGVLAALLVRNPSFRSWISTRLWLLNLLSGICFLGIAYLTYWAWDQYSPPMSTWGLSCLALFYTCILLSVVCGTSIAERLLRNPCLMRLGTVAYCTYLVHSILIQAARRVLEMHTSLSTGQNWAIGGVLGVCAAFVVASCSWRFFEKTLLAYGHKYQYWSS